MQNDNEFDPNSDSDFEGIEIIQEDEILCATCRFIEKCPTFQFIGAVIQQVETKVFTDMGADLLLSPTLTYCPKYMKNPAMINRQQ